MYNIIDAIQRALVGAGSVFKWRTEDNIQEGEISSDQVKTARRLVNWTVAMAADKSRLSVATISRFENGKRIPSVGNVSEIRKAFEGVGVAFIEAGASLK